MRAAEVAGHNYTPPGKTAIRLVRYLGPHRSAIITLLRDHGYMSEVAAKISLLSQGLAAGIRTEAA